MARSPDHYYEAPHLTKRSMGNVGPCCTRPEADHPAFVDGVDVTITLRRQLRGLKGTVFPKGTTLRAKRESYEGFAEVRPSRWGTNELGQFAELDKGEYSSPRMPGYLVIVDTYNTGIPASMAREVDR